MRDIRLAGVIGSFLIFTAASAVGDTCKTELLRPGVLRIVKPLMELRIKQSADQFTEDGHWKGESPHTPDVNRIFEALLKDRSKEGDEALAYLLSVYMGEGAGEGLVCEVTNRGKRMLPLIEKYSSCPAVTGLEPLPKFVQGSGVLAREAKQQISAGKRCGYEE